MNGAAPRGARFDPFGDHAERGYLRNAGGFHDKADVARLEHRSFVENLPAALEALRGRERIGYADLLETHATLFKDVYPWAGRDRAETAPGIAVTKAGRSDLFAHPLETRLAGSYALDEGQKPGRMRRKPGHVLGLLAHAHPFLDGNGRTIMTVHAELARRQGVAIDWTRSEKGAYLAALTAELTDPGKGALDAYMEPFVVEVDGRRPLHESLTRVEGLNPGHGAKGWAAIAPTRADLEAALAARGTAGETGAGAFRKLDTPTATFLANAGAGVRLAEHVHRDGRCVPSGRTLEGDAALRALLEGFGKGARRTIEATPAPALAAMGRGATGARTALLGSWEAAVAAGGKVVRDRGGADPEALDRMRERSSRER